jgi:hypothetical protein
MRRTDRLVYLEASLLVRVPDKNSQRKTQLSTDTFDSSYE